jgi:phosphatidylserine/phosphatidylglycerophosphate/cardiolipin synthase-like enzyme
MKGRVHVCCLALVVLLVGVGSFSLDVHQDPCHRRHACPSDSQTYVCGDKGRCEQCPDTQYCLAGKPRPTSSSTPTPAPPTPSPSTTTTPSAVTVCFTPGGNCTDAIVKALSEAKRTILVQAYSFTAAPIAKTLLDAHTRGVQVQVILDKSQRTEKYWVFSEWHSVRLQMRAVSRPGAADVVVCS